ncbi:MAG: glycosyltransferase family 39 protein [Terriglobales bacterium]
MKTVDATAGGAGDQKSPESFISSPQEASSPFELILLALITALAAALRFHSLAAKSFWFDEGVSVAIARLDWYNFVRILWRREANMSLYYLLLHFWLEFGGSEFFVRSLSVFFAIASVPVIYLLGRRLFGSRVGLITAALLAVNAYHVQYSQDARSYSLMVFLCLLSSLYFLKCLSEPSRRNRIAYIVSSTLAVYAQFFSLLLVIAHWLSLRMLDRGQEPRQIRNDWRWIVLLSSPILAFAAATGTGPLRWVQRPSLKDVWVFALHLTGNGGPWLLIACVVSCLAALLPVWRTRRLRSAHWDAWEYRFLVCWLIFPIALTLALSLVKPLFVPRYFIFCLPALLLLVACGIARLRPVLMVPALLLVLVLSFSGTIGYYKKDVDIQREDWRAATRYLLDHAQSGDALLFHVPMGRMPYEFYHSVLGATSTAPIVLYPHHGDRVTFLNFVEKPDDARLESFLPEHRRAWLVLTYAETQSGLPDARSIELTNLLGKFYPVVVQRDFPGIEILLYSTGNAEKHIARALPPQGLRY